MFKCNVCTAQFKTQKGLDNHKCRWVHVRYEEKRKYNKDFEITYYTEEGQIFYEANVFCDLQSAEKDAQMRQKDYQKDCDFAAFCR